MPLRRPSLCQLQLLIRWCHNPCGCHSELHVPRGVQITRQIKIKHLNSKYLCFVTRFTAHCAVLPVVSSSSLSDGATTRVGATVNFTCHEGFKLPDNATVFNSTCLTTGNWSHYDEWGYTPQCSGKSQVLGVAGCVATSYFIHVLTVE